VAEGEAAAGRQQGADGGGGAREEAKRRRAAEKRAKETQKRDAARLKAQAKKVRKERGRCGFVAKGSSLNMGDVDGVCRMRRLASSRRIERPGRRARRRTGNAEATPSLCRLWALTRPRIRRCGAQQLSWD
jgi:hypothetical protein